MTELEELRLAYQECSRQRNELLNKLKSHAQRTWVGLTDEDEGELLAAVIGSLPVAKNLIRAIEAKLREKNT